MGRMLPPLEVPKHAFVAIRCNDNFHREEVDRLIDYLDKGYEIIDVTVVNNMVLYTLRALVPFKFEDGTAN